MRGTRDWYCSANRIHIYGQRDTYYSSYKPVEILTLGVTYGAILTPDNFFLLKAILFMKP